MKRKITTKPHSDDCQRRALQTSIYKELLYLFVSHERNTLKKIIKLLSMSHRLYPASVDFKRNYGTYNQGIDGAIEVIKQQLKKLESEI